MTDQDQIQRLMARYNIGGDRGQIDELTAVFAEDGILTFGGGSSKGREAIAARLSSGKKNPELIVSRHHLTTSLVDVDVDGDAAKSRTYFSVLTNIGLDHHGVYVDRFSKVDGTWLIQHREVRIDWQSPSSLLAPLYVRGIKPE